MTTSTLDAVLPFPAAADAPAGGAGPAAAEATPSTAELMRRVQEGDTDAFRPIVERYERRLYGYFLNLTRDPAAAADLAQETFVRVYRAAPRYRESGRFEPWLFRIASNLVRSERRRGAVRGFAVPLEEAVAGGPDQTPAPGVGGPDEATWRSELRDALRRALPRLPVTFREAVLLRDVEGWSYREIASMLGVREGTVKSRAHRGRKQLRELLAPAFEGVPS